MTNKAVAVLLALALGGCATTSSGPPPLPKLIANMNKDDPAFNTEECRIARVLYLRLYGIDGGNAGAGGTIAGAGAGAGIPALGIVGALVALGGIANAYQQEQRATAELKRDCRSAVRE